MIIGVRQLLQKINSNQLTGVQDEEIIWHLNEEQYRFINQRMSDKSNPKGEGFQHTQKRYDDLQELITPAIIPMYYRDDDSVYGNLPADYLRLINDRSMVDDLCNRSFTSLTTTGDVLYYAVVPMDKLVDFYSKATLKYNTSTSVVNISTVAALVSQLVDETTKSILINYLLQNVSITGIDIYWENWNSTYYQNSFVFVSTTNFNNIVWTGSGFTYTYNTSSVTLTKYNVLSVSETPNRLTKTEDIFDLLVTQFGTTVAHSPISSLALSKLIVYHKRKFILKETKIDYIRKPRPIDLSLNQSCELNEDAQKNLLINVSKLIAGVIESAAYPQITNENRISE